MRDPLDEDFERRIAEEDSESGPTIFIRRDEPPPVGMGPRLPGIVNSPVVTIRSRFARIRGAW